MAKPRLRLLFCDHLNLARGKYLPAEKLKADGTSRFSQSLFGVHFDRDLLPSPGSRMLEGAPATHGNRCSIPLLQLANNNLRVGLPAIADVGFLVHGLHVRGPLRHA